MKKQKELLIIMPAYNEEKNIEAVLYELEKPEISSIADILVMNDASSDSTNWVVKAHGHTLVTHVFNLGIWNSDTVFSVLQFLALGQFCSSSRKSTSCPVFRVSAPGSFCSAAPWNTSAACIPDPA